MKPRVLYITHRVPWPPDRGDRIRTWNILKFLSQRADVDLICLADEPVTTETRNALHSVTSRLAIVPHSGKRRYLRGALSLASGRTVTEGLFESRMLRSLVRVWGRKTDYTAAMASSSGIARYLQKPLLPNVGRVWIDLIDVDSQKWLDYSRSARLPMSLIYGMEGRRLRRLETELASSTDRLLVVSDAERELFRDFCPTAPIQAIGNGVDTEYFSPANATVTPHSCVFVGVLNYLPNSDAARWFAEHVWTKVRERFPDAVFRIVGKNPTPEVLSLNAVPGIEVIGPVPDVRPWLNESTCVVVPLRIARGVQNKVLEAMACGRPTVCSPAPLKGLQVESGLHLLQADSIDEWVSHITTVFEDRCRAEELGMAASAWVQLNHRWKTCLEPLSEMMETVRSEPEYGIEVGS
ncbi:MAG: TIGR03087 family PEP-CTERM/XrtA system glycosyltransferase [Planctomycetaceae bacterium]